MVPKEVIDITTMDEFYSLLNSLNLSDRQREVFVMKYSRQLTHEKIAEKLGVSTDAICDDSKVIRTKLAAIQRGQT